MNEFKYVRFAGPFFGKGINQPGSPTKKNVKCLCVLMVLSLMHGGLRGNGDAGGRGKVEGQKDTIKVRDKKRKKRSKREKKTVYGGQGKSFRGAKKRVRDKRAEYQGRVWWRGQRDVGSMGGVNGWGRKGQRWKVKGTRVKRDGKRDKWVKEG